MPYIGGETLGGSANVIQVTQNSHGLSLGFPVKISGNGTYAHASADTAANAEAIGIIIATTTNTMTIALGGRVTVDGCVPNLTAGTVLFLQVSAGLLAAVEPSGNNQVSKPMAVITIANSEMIMVQQRGEVISTAGITLADESVDSDHYVDGSIDSAHIGNDQIDSQHYAAQSIDNEHLADDAVGADELAANAVVNASVASGAEIEFSKMENLTASRLLVSDGNGDVSVSSVTTTNLTDLTDAGETALHTHAGAASDTAYASSWNGVTTIPPSKNAVYDKIETLTVPSDIAYASSWNGVTTIAPSKNAVYDKIESMGSATAVGWRLHWNGTKSVNSNSNTSMNWNVESGNGAFDAGGFHTNGSSDEDSANAIITVPSGAAGVYIITTTINYQANQTTGKRNVSFAHTPSGGSTHAKMGVSLDAAVADDGAGPHISASTILNLGVGDTLAVRLWHTQGSALDMTGDGTGGSMHFAGIKVSDAP